MEGILNYLRNLIGSNDDDELPISIKRGRDNDDDPPIMKKYKTVPNHFPKVMPKEDETEWMNPRRLASVRGERIIPIRLEKDMPSTSTPASHIQETRNLLKSLEKFDFGKSLDEPATSQLKRPLTLSLRSRNDSDVRPSFFRSDNVSPSFLKLPFQMKPTLSSLEFNAPSVSRQRFFKRTSPTLPLLHVDNKSDPYTFSTSPPLKEKFKFFKSSNKPSEKLANNLEVIEISDSEDHTYYVVKEPKQHVAKDKDVVQVEDSEEEEEEVEDERSCKSCKSKDTSWRSISPYAKDKFSRFKKPLSVSKARRLNSYTPFWKSQKRLSGGLSKPVGRLKRLENSKAIAERCIRLDDKKKYEELIKLSAGSFFRKSNANTPSSFTFRETQKRINDLTSSIAKGDDLYAGIDLQNGISEKSTPEEGSVVALSDLDSDQPPSPDGSSTSSLKVNAVNSLKQSFKEKSVASSNWMEELNNKYKNIRLDKKQEAEDRLLMSTKHSKTSRELWFKLKEKRLQSLQIDLTVEDEASKEVPLPELTNEQITIIHHSLRPNPPNQVLIQKFNLDITRRDINTLAGLNWLNDEVINFYMNLIMERSNENQNLPKVYAMNTFFYPKLLQSGQAGLRRWTRKVDIFSYHMIVAPIHLGVHWCMSIIDFRHKSIRYFDSMGGKNMECVNALAKYLEDESMDKKQVRFDTSGWQKECVKDIPQQMNGSDCGMFSCTFAEFLSRDAPITFTQNEMPYLRQKMVLEIVQGKLLL